MDKSYCFEFNGIDTDVNQISFCIDTEQNIILLSDEDYENYHARKIVTKIL
jgi:hypothetical protein